MNIQTGHNNNKPYIRLTGMTPQILRESDLNDLLAACYPVNTNRILLHHTQLAPEFLDLKTGFAGMILGKCAVYSITAAFVLDSFATLPVRFQELVRESNKGNSQRFFEDEQAAVAWLTRE